MAPPGAAIGVDVGGTNIRAARVSPSGMIEGRVRSRAPVGKQSLLERILELVRSLLDNDIGAIGIGVPGRLSPDGQTVVSAGFVELEGVRLRDWVEVNTERRVVVDSDSRMAMVAEMNVGAAVGRRDAVLFTIGTGIGGAIVEGGRLSTGRENAGQLGHLTVDLHGPVCRCGRRGCIETLGSGTALRGYIKAAGLPTRTSVEDLFRLDSGGQSEATEVLLRWARPLREAVDSVVAALDPEIVLLGGGLGAAAARALTMVPPGSAWYQCPVVPAALGDDAGMVGAALRALSETGSTVAR